MNLETDYTSTFTKLIRNPDKLKEIKQGKLLPQSLQLAPTDICNLNCSFCSVKNRTPNTLKLDDIKKTLYDLKELGLKTVEITGGGDPTMYEDINALIFICKDMGLKIGLITNGVMLKEKITPENLNRLTWVRVSMNCLEQVGEIELPVFSDNTTLGFSYVWTEISTPEMLDKIQGYKEKYGAKYVRVVPNCLSAEWIDKCRKEVPKLIKNRDGFFFQSKEYVPYKNCYVGYLKPFLYTDGYFYHCSANPLIDRKFNVNFRMGKMDEVKKIWEKPEAFCTNSHKCGLCFFSGQNELIENLMIPNNHELFL